MSKKCSLCTIRILLGLGSHHVDFQNRPLSKSISQLQFKLQIHNEIKFTTLVYHCDHKVTHCTDSVVKSSSTLLFPMIFALRGLLERLRRLRYHHSKHFMEVVVVCRCNTYPNVTAEYICSFEERYGHLPRTFQYNIDSSVA